MHRKPEVTDYLDMGAALGLLINLSGKMRMLSHRIAMFVLARDTIGERGGRELDEALTEFCEIYDALRNGSDAMRIAPEVAQTLRVHEAIDRDSAAAIERFIAMARMLRHGGEGPVNLEMVDFVSGVLLDRLNGVTAGVSRTLDAVLDVQRRNSRKAEAAIAETLDAIQKVSLSVRLIAINAATEAVRAGEAGRGFAVIASEIRALSDRTTDLVTSVRMQMQ